MNTNKFLTLKEEMIYLYFGNSFNHSKSFCFWETEICGVFSDNLANKALKELCYWVITFQRDKALDYLQRLPKDAETQGLWDFYDALEFCNHFNVGVFPLTIPYSQWMNGPHLPCNGKQDSWYFGRVYSVDQTIGIYIIDFRNCSNPKDATVAEIELDIDKYPSLKKDDYVELHFYGVELEVVLYQGPNNFTPPVDVDNSCPDKYSRIRHYCLLESWGINPPLLAV